MQKGSQQRGQKTMARRMQLQGWGGGDTQAMMTTAIGSAGLGGYSKWDAERQLTRATPTRATQ